MFSARVPPLFSSDCPIVDFEVMRFFLHGLTRLKCTAPHNSHGQRWNRKMLLNSIHRYTMGMYIYLFAESLVTHMWFSGIIWHKGDDSYYTAVA